MADTEAYYRRCLDLCKNTVTLGYPRVALLVSGFARFLDRRGHREEAFALFDEMVRARRSRFSPGHPMIADGLAMQGAFLFRRDIKRSEQVTRESLAVYSLHPEHQSGRLLDAHEGLGRILFERGDYDEAGIQIRASLALIDRLPKSDFDDQPDSKAWDLGRLGIILVHQTKLDEAEATLNESIRLFRSEVAVVNRSNIYFALDGMSFLRRRQNRPLEAIGLTEERRKACVGNANDLYKVASDLASCIPMIGPTIGPPTASQLEVRERFGKQAFAILQEAVRAGFKDRRRLRNDPALVPLQTIAEFQTMALDIGFPASKPFAP